jgi:hypothetical protein
MTKVSRPPVFRVGHKIPKVFLEGEVVEGLEGFSIIEAGTEGVTGPMVLAKNVKLKCVGPPVSILRTTISRVDMAMVNRTLAFRHID